ncbi:MAG: CMP-2-keto-3-deoxyoctulosonic acid synthetase [Eggerthellales bacterium]|nr:CMP-2-keto-3-deoxyoctulosonic acid synthetase [Eggerthellales bacterium]
MKKKGNVVAKIVAAGLFVCVAAAGIGFASTTIMSPDEVSVGLGSVGTFQTRITVSESVPRPVVVVPEPSTVAASGGEETGGASGPAADPAADGTGNADGAASGSADGAASGSVSGAASGGASGSSSTDVFAQKVQSRSALNDLTPCDISAGLKTLNDRIEEARRIEEERRLAAERAHIAQVQERQRAYGGESAVAEVDFSVGQEAFIEEWARRIDNYLAGSPLAGYGNEFAAAAWEYGVDPRFSPAISNTESGKGSNCFLPHNAWGWGASMWFNWPDAIWAHVKGLSDGYGYSITYAGAAKYCPPNTDNWYNNTKGEMARI